MSCSMSLTTARDRDTREGTMNFPQDTELDSTTKLILRQKVGRIWAKAAEHSTT